MVAMKLTNLWHRLSSVALLVASAFRGPKEGAYHRPAAPSIKLDASPIGHAGDISYRESCRSRNQRKIRKDFRRLIAAGGA